MAAVEIGRRRHDAHAARRPLLVHYAAAWCGPCKVANGLVRSFCASRGDAAPEVMDIDVDRCVHDVGVNSVPTFHLYRPRTVGHLTHVGVEGLQAWLLSHAV